MSNKVITGLVVLALSLVAMPSASTQRRSDRERDGLVGPVRSVVMETLSLKCVTGGFVDVGRRTSSEEYDLSGRLMGNRNRFAVTDPLSRMLFYPFDESIPRIEKPAYRDDGSLIYREVFTYDNKARRSEHVFYRSDGTAQFRSITIFDDHGRLAETKSYNANGVLASWNVITRDERGNEVESASYKEDGTLVEEQNGNCSYLLKFVSTSQFDGAGNWIEQTVFRPILRSGQPILEPFVVRHRTVTYY